MRFIWALRMISVEHRLALIRCSGYLPLTLHMLGCSYTAV